MARLRGAVFSSTSAPPASSPTFSPRSIATTFCNSSIVSSSSLRNSSAFLMTRRRIRRPGPDASVSDLGVSCSALRELVRDPRQRQPRGAHLNNDHPQGPTLDPKFRVFAAPLGRHGCTFPRPATGPPEGSGTRLTTGSVVGITPSCSACPKMSGFSIAASRGNFLESFGLRRNANAWQMQPFATRQQTGT